MIQHPQIAVMTPEQVEALIERTTERVLSSAPALPHECAELERLKRKAMLTPKEVKELYGWSIGTLANWRSAGRGPEYVQDGDGPVYYEHEAIKAYLKACRKKTYA